MGTVYDASTTDGRPVALKILRVEQDDPRNRMLVARFLREARLLQQIRHRGIVRIIDTGFADGYLYLALERIDGASLRAVHELGPLPLGVLVWLGVELSEAMSYFHRAGIVHRDIKPSNVLIDDVGVPRLIDFGIATYLGATNITSSNAILGTLGFVAPEVLDGKASPLSDQYSLGRLMISLASPYPRTEREKKSRERRILEGLHIDWTHFPDGGRWPIMQLILQRMVSDQAERRYDGMASCAKVMRALARSVSAQDEARAVLRARSREAKAKERPLPEPLLTAPSAWIEEIPLFGQRGIVTDVLPRRVQSQA
jgi:serine/threonine protein kinase